MYIADHTLHICQYKMLFPICLYKIDPSPFYKHYVYNVHGKYLIHVPHTKLATSNSSQNTRMYHKYCTYHMTLNNHDFSP